MINILNQFKAKHYKKSDILIQVLFNVICTSYFLLCEDWEIAGILWTISLHNVRQSAQGECCTTSMLYDTCRHQD